MRIDPEKPKHPNRDRFILSKGHGAAALYATLALRGFFPEKMLHGYRVSKGTFHGHPSKDMAPGLEVSTGALGHGLSIGVGMAYALKNTKSKVYVLVGDGECNEGSIWEAALSAGALRLSNIVAIIDDNKFQGFAASKEKNPFDLAAQWRSFGWDVIRVDGHQTSAIEKAFNRASKAKKPTVVIADTVAGKGIPAIEHTLGAHYYVPNESDVAALKRI
jgi:transketolase